MELEKSQNLLVFTVAGKGSLYTNYIFKEL